jgi:AraC family transcriptional regulator of adaptative response / DNA-3-methyladenine glycosylase II
VSFLRTPAAAEEAGFRACLRCRPDASPDSAAWLGTSATVARALRLIDEEVPGDGGGVEELASRLGMGERHLRRLFVEQLGAPPRAIVSTRRAHFARKLLEETRLPVGVVARSAGYRSLRRFNAAIRDAFGRSPRELRGGGAGRPDRARAAGEALELRLPYKPPLDWQSLMGFVALRAIAGVEEVVGDCYRRIVSIDGIAGWIEVSPNLERHALRLRVHAPVGPGLSRLVRRVRRLFDLDADPDRIARDLRRDSLLAPLIRSGPGLRVPGAFDGFETSIRAVLGQQVSVRGATTLAGRLVERFGTLLSRGDGGAAAPVPAGLTHLFPAPGLLARADLTLIGLPRARAEAIRSLARAVSSGEISLDASETLDDAVSRLKALPGIGDWTAQYIAMRALGEPDALPAGDLALRQVLGLSPAAIQKRAEPWRPWRAYAVMHLWKSVADGNRSSAGKSSIGSTSAKRRRAQTIVNRQGRSGKTGARAAR